MTIPTRRPAPWLLCLLVGTLWPAGALPGSPGPTPTPMPKIHGQWRIDFDRKDDFLRLTRDSKPPELTRFRLEDCLGLQRPSGSAKKPVSFKIARDAGDFEFEGHANASEGEGHFVFNPDDDFIEDVTLEQLWAMTLLDVSHEFVRNLHGIGLTRQPKPDQLIAMRRYGVDPDFILELKRLGYAKPSVENLILLRKNGVTIEEARRMKAERPGISMEELARTKTRGK